MAIASSDHQTAVANDYRLRKIAWLWLAFCGGFIVYGSLYPFDFLEFPRSVDSLIQEWSPLRDRADAIDNFALFVPIGLGIWFAVPSWLARVVLGVVVWFVLGPGLQFVQLYLPSRVASLSDALWNGFGIVAGLVAARAASPMFVGWRPSTQGYPFDRFAMVAVALWVCYESFPFLPTLDVSLLRAHVKSFVFAPAFEWDRLAQHAVAAILGTLALLRCGLRFPRWLVLAVMVAVVLGCEVSAAYGSLRRESVAGIVLGMLVAERLERFTEDRCRYLMFFVALGLYVFTVVVPVKGQPPDGSFTLTPFSGLLWHGVTSGIPPAALEMLAIASMLWAGTAGRGVFNQKPAIWIVGVLLVVLMLEAVRVFVAGYHGDTTPAVLTFLLAALLLGLHRPKPQPTRQPRHAGATPYAVRLRE